jgi:hypothetical protein
MSLLLLLETQSVIINLDIFSLKHKFDTKIIPYFIDLDPVIITLSIVITEF